MLSEKFFGGCEKLEAIFRLGEAVALVGEEHVLVLDALALHGLDNLFRLRLFYTRVICPLTNQDRDLDLIDPEQWRTRIQKLFLGIGITDPLVEGRQESRPIWGNCPYQCVQVGRAYNVYGTAEKVVCKRCTHQGSVATIGSTEDCHLFRVRDAFIYCPLHGVYQVVVHVSSPLPITSVDKILAIACRTPKIYL